MREQDEHSFEGTSVTQSSCCVAAVRVYDWILWMSVTYSGMLEVANVLCQVLSDAFQFRVDSSNAEVALTTQIRQTIVHLLLLLDLICEVAFLELYGSWNPAFRGLDHQCAQNIVTWHQPLCCRSLYIRLTKTTSIRMLSPTLN